MKEIEGKPKEAKLEKTETLFCPKCEQFMRFKDIKEKILECQKHGSFKYNGPSIIYKTPAKPLRDITIPKNKKTRENN